MLRGDNALADARAYYQKAFEVQNGLVSRNAKEAVAAQKAPDSSLKSNLAATYTHWGLLEKGAGNLELALEKLRQGVALDEELTKNEPGNPQWQEFLTPNYLYLAETLEGLKRPDEALAYYRKLNDARRTLAYRAPGRSKPQKDWAEAAKLLGDRSTGLAQIEAYREAVRTWNRLVEDPRNADAAADQYDVVLGFARTFDAKKDWPDAQSAYRVAMKIAVLNYVKDPSATSWRDKAEEAERASVVAGKAAETAAADAPPLERGYKSIGASLPSRCGRRSPGHSAFLRAPFISDGLSARRMQAMRPKARARFCARTLTPTPLPIGRSEERPSLDGL